MRKINLFIACMFGLSMYAQNTDSPEWTKNLIICEVATKGFTSPAGAESGTFRSTIEKIPYLKELGVNGIWLTGQNWANNDHFYGIWNQYATIRPDSIDPTLGTPSDFKAMIDAFHKSDIRIFLDVITHGVMAGSPLIKEHPEWFRGGSWGMVDYDWDGNHADLDAWWVKTFTDYTLKYGVDGYRLDVAIYRPDLWKQIKKNCADAGHPIVVWLEGDGYTGGACDFHQRMNTLSLQIKGLDPTNVANSNTGKYYLARYSDPAFYFVRVYYNDGSVSAGTSFNDPFYTDNVTGQLWWLLQLTLYKDMQVKVLSDPHVKPANEKYKVDGEKIKLQISNLKKEKQIAKISVTGFNIWEETWTFTSQGKFGISIPSAEQMELSLEPIVPDLKYRSTQISSHDDGWETFPADANPYVAEGSRCVFGYSCLFTPSIPVFMSGEEFDADYKPLPRHTPDLYGKGERGKGKWLYASWIQWDQLKEKKHAEMLADVKKMIAIRKQNSDVFCASTTADAPKILELEYKADQTIPVPYIIWNGKKAFVVAGNNTDKDVQCTVTIPVEKIGLAKIKSCTDLWNNKTLPVKSNTISFVIKKDKTAAGGVIIIKLE